MKILTFSFVLLEFTLVSNSVAQFRLLTETGDSLYYLGDSKSASIVQVKSSLGSAEINKNAVVFNVVTIPSADLYCRLQNIPDSTARSFVSEFYKIFSWSSAYERDSLFGIYFNVEKARFRLFYDDSLLNAKDNSSFVIHHREGTFTVYVVGKMISMKPADYSDQILYPKDFNPFLSGTLSEALYDFAQTFQKKNKTH